MKYTELPEFDYRLIDKVEAEEPASFIEFFEAVSADTPVAWYSYKDEQAHPGVWVRRGRYRLKHGSFVDPADLSAYSAQYYEPYESGRHEAVQIGRTPQAMAAPDGVTAAPTVGDLIEAIRALAPEVFRDERAGDGVAAEAGAGSGAEAEAVASAADPFAELKFLQPDYAFEFHGALTRGWHGQRYAAAGEGDEAAAELLVLR